MARYWVGGTGNWNDTAHWSDTSGGASGFSVPGTTDNVIFDANSNATAYTVTVNATADCADFTMGAPASGAVTWAGSSALSIYGSMDLQGGTSGITRTFTGTITFKATATGKTVTCNGITFATGAWAFNGSGGGWTLQDALTNTSSISLTTGSLDTNGVSVTSSSFVFNGNATRSLTLGASTITITGTAGILNFGSILNLTFNAGTSTIVWAGTSNFSSGSGLTFNDLSVTGAGNKTISGPNNWSNISITGTTSKTGTLSFSGDATLSGTFICNGNSVTNRVLIWSSTNGINRTISAATVSVTNTDFMDITGTGAGSWNLSAVSGGSGDCGGNSGITFTTPVTRYWVGGTGNWSSTGEWASSSGGGSGATVPLPQDTVVFDANSFSAGSQTATADMPRLGKDISFTGVTNSPTLSFGSLATMITGSLTLDSGLTLTGTNTTTFVGRAACTITSAGKSFNQAITINCGAGSYTLQDNLNINGSTLQFTITTGTFDANDFNVTTGTFNTNNNNSRVISMGSGTWTITGVGTSAWVVTAGSLTLNAETSTIKFTDSTNNVITFIGGGFTYYIVWWSRGASTASNTIKGSNAYYEFKDTGTAAHSILFTVSTTNTVTLFTVNGSSGNAITLNSTNGSTTFALVKVGGGRISCDWLNIQHSVATPATGTWYAGANSVNNQATASAGSGWIFSVPPLIAKAYEKMQAVHRAGSF